MIHQPRASTKVEEELEEEDRLHALAGIARELEKAWSDGYIVGMWQSDLFSWLLWRRDPKQQSQNI